MKLLHNAVRAAHKNAVTVYGNDIDSLIVNDINGDQIQIDPNLVNAQIPVLENELVEKEKTITETKASALAKLTALGLTADEIKAITGA